MKRNFLFTSVLASLFVAGCSKEDITPNGDGKDEAKTSYMAVNLMSSDVTRAAEGYEDGSDVENNVSKVRFYFFTENGSAANVKLQGSSYVNYYDWTPGTGDQTDDKDSDDTESLLAATIVINTKSGDKLPQMVAAVLNPVGLANTSKSMDDLKKVVNDYTTRIEKGEFVMFNSVYKDSNNGTEVCAVPIEAKHLQKTVDAAKANAVTIFVERSVAKVEVALDDKIGFDAKTNLLALKESGETPKPIIIDGQQVYLKLEGWSLTADTDNSRLVKAISLTWTSNWWNGTHRSFWAINSPSAKNRYHSYANIDTSFASAMYTNENAMKLNDATNGLAANNTKVILKGTLCKADGTALTLVRHLGAHFVDTSSDDPASNLPALKKSILSQLKANSKNYYYETEGSDGVKKREQIDTDDLQIVIATPVAQEDSGNNCYVYAQLNDNAKSKTWYDSLSEDAQPMTNAVTTINNTLKDKDVVDWALAWNSGQTYYYYEIIHHGKSSDPNATKGVVRNHIYKTTVTKIAGLGTPVYDPSKEIYPEKPNPNDHYIAAEINILSWRIVDNEYALEW